MKKMEEALGVAGWVLSDDLDRLEDKSGERIALWSDPDDDRVEIQVDPEGVREVRIGKTARDKTFVQVIIDRAERVTVHTRFEAPEGFVPFADPILANLSARAIVTKIMI